MITAETYEGLRDAGIEDVGGILELIAPLEISGVLVRRSREQLELEVSRFVVIERDGMIIACAALYPYTEDRVGEVACLATHPSYQRGGRAQRLLTHIEEKATTLGLTRLLVLTTQAAHWFRERGFERAELPSLPVKRRTLYNYQRNSQMYVKALNR
jgi:amino-acid N-acetyltransferase